MATKSVYTQFIIVMAFVAFLPLMDAVAQHPIEVERATADGKHFESLKLARKVPKRKITPTMALAAARSSWALSLHDDAQKWFDLALRAETLSERTKKHVLFSKAVIAFQDREYEKSTLYAERAADIPLTSELDWKLWMLVGDGLYKQGLFAEAERRFQQALALVPTGMSTELHFRLGKSHFRLGNLSEAKSHFRALSLEDERAAESLRFLAQIALQQEDYPGVRLWLEKGRELHPESFLDSWTDFALMRAAVRQNKSELVQEIRSEAQKRYPPSDHWFTLLDAEAEAWLGRSVGEKL